MKHDRTYRQIRSQALVISAFLIGCILSSLVRTVEAQDNETHVYLVGNLADMEPGAPEATALASQIRTARASVVLLFSGDISKSDLTDRQQRQTDSTRIRRLIVQWQVREDLEMVFLPGDRDWSYSGSRGWENANILEEMLESLPYGNITWKPGHGCPGPMEVDVGENLTILVINTQYWNHPFEKPIPADALCKISSRDDFMEEFEDVLAEPRNRNLLVAGHFPMVSGGEYGGRMNLKKHVFPLTDLAPGLWVPLPVAGSFYPAYRQNIGSGMDIVNARYETFNEDLRNIVRDHPGLVCVSGHDYIRELIRADDSYFINSGALSKAGYTGRSEGQLFRGTGNGIIRLEYHADGNISARIFRQEGEELEEEAFFRLYSTACVPGEEDVPVNEYYAPCGLNTIFPESMTSAHAGDVVAVAGEEYAAGGLKKLFFGQHYRTTWTEPVSTRYLDLDNVFDGLTPVKRGGGRQTTSLKFRAGNGCEYVFRSVNKDPKKALSYELRETVVADVVRDQTSTQQPYGALATRIMLEELDILHPSPFLYVLPPDDKLGPFRDEFSGLFGMLEESPKSPAGQCAGFGGSDEVIRSYKLFRKLYDDHDNTVDQHEFAKARVFDIFVGDWGRHEDNWKWAGYWAEDGINYRPIPRDRDHVFSVWDGLLPWLVDRKWAKPSGDHFGYRVHDVRSLTWSARHLDRVLLTRVGRSEWIAQTNVVKQKMTDELIEASVRNMPEEAYRMSGEEIVEKLKRRRDHLDEFTMDYYGLLAEYVDVIGSGKREVFLVDRQEDNSVLVRMTNRKGSRELYNRTFFPDETKEIRLYGLGNEDVFRIRGSSRHSILIRVIGGPGDDSIVDGSIVRGTRKMTRIYEKDGGSYIRKGTEARRMHPRDHNAYDYDRHAFAYNTYFPIPFLGYNADDGLILGLGITFTRQRFGREEYSARHSLDLKGSVAGNLQFAYRGRLHHLLGRWDLVYSASAAYPTDFVYFYGYGNETVKSDSLFRADHYKTRYNSIRLGTGLVRDFMKRSRLGILLTYENNDGQVSENTILDIPSEILGKGKVNLFEGTAVLDLDFRNDRSFPGRGMRFYGEFTQGLITSNDNSTYNKATGFIEFHSTIPLKLPLILGLKGGGALSSGDIPFYKLVNIGQGNYLRGYRKNRFAGKSMVFFNSDLKLQILDVVTPIVPVKFGIRGFFDLGKVFVEDITSKKLHMGYGGGLYLIPLEKSYSLAMNLAFSEEEKKGLFVLEFGITF